MSEIESNLDKAASAYWMSVAAKAGPDHAIALANASNLGRWNAVVCTSVDTRQ